MVACLRQAVGTPALLLLLEIGSAMAAPQDYMFELGQLEARTGTATVIVRLIDMSSGKAVPDALIVENSVEMVMPAKAPVPATAAPARADGRGAYRFEVTLPIRGDWVVHLAAKVPGEPEIVRGDVKLMAMP